MVLGCPIRTSTGHKLFAPLRSFSQLITSFIASQSQGIHHVLLIIFLSLFLFNILHNAFITLIKSTLVLLAS